MKVICEDDGDSPINHLSYIHFYLLINKLILLEKIYQRELCPIFPSPEPPLMNVPKWQEECCYFWKCRPTLFRILRTAWIRCKEFNGNFEELTTGKGMRKLRRDCKISFAAFFSLNFYLCNTSCWKEIRKNMLRLS